MMDQQEEAAKKMEPEQISGRGQDLIPDPEGKGGQGADRANESEGDTQRSELKVKINANNNAGENSSDHVVQSPLNSGRSKKSVRWSEELVTESPSTRAMASDGLNGGSNQYVSSSPTPSYSSTFKDSMHSVRDVLGRWGKKVGEATRKAEDLSKNTWQHLKTAPSFADAALGRIAQGTKVLAEGGYEKIFRQTFETVPEEQLKDSFACYLSTSAGPVMGVLYVSSAKLAFCSDNPLSYKSGEKTEWSYYKVVIPLHQLKAVNPSTSRVNPAEKFIQVISVDNHEFWYMGFLNYDSAVKCFHDTLQAHDFSA